MIIDHLNIVNYKNIVSADLQFSPNVNAFIGLNGQGKTNLLDALHFLSFCKSATQPQDSACVTHGEGFFVLQGDYVRHDDTREQLCCGLKVGAKKQMRRNGKAYKRLSEHIGMVPLVMVSPSDASLVTGGSEERRRLIDQVVSQYDRDYLNALVSYNKALQQRNALLKMDAEPDADLLLLWEEEMARTGELIYDRRRSFVERFIPVFQAYYDEISQGQERVALTYTSHCQRGPLLDTLIASRAKDRIMGYSLHGIHRDDLDMTIDGFQLRREGSQGQCKTFLISMKLAQHDFLRSACNDTTPLLLLDDIFDKLDADRVEQIVRLVSSNHFGQIFITDTNRDHLDLILGNTQSDYHIFNVKGGVIIG